VPEILDLSRQLGEISVFLMTMDAKLDEIFELLGGDDGEADSADS
jgi:hypothetical protein